MPHHYGRSKRSTSTNTRPNPHTSSGSSKATHVSSGAITTAKNYQKKNKPKNIVQKVVEGSMVGRILTSLSKGLEGRDLERRKKFITSYNKKLHPSQRLTFTDEYLGTDEGRDELRSKYGYRTALDINSEGNNNNGSVIKKVVGGQTLLAQSPTNAEVSQSDATNAAAETKLTKRRVKARGRKMNIYSQSKDKLTLGKKSLLGYA